MKSVAANRPHRLGMRPRTLNRHRASPTPAIPHSHDDVTPSEVKIYLLKSGRLVRVPLRELLANRRETSNTGDDETSPELQAQIKESYAAYVRGDVRPLSEFIDELDVELGK